MAKVIVFKSFTIVLKRGKTEEDFIKDLDKLCNRYISREKDVYFSWDLADN